MRRLVIVGLLAGVAMFQPSAALGECDGPFPSFRNAAPSARRIVIGQVVATLPGPPGFDDGRTSQFALRGWSVLDGDKPVDINVQDVQSQPCAGYIIARPGDRIAIAFDGHDFKPPMVVNAVAWIEGAPPRFEGIESTNIGAIYALLGRVQPTLIDPAAAPPMATAASDDPLVVLGLAVVLVVAAVVGLRLSRRMREPT